MNEREYMEKLLQIELAEVCLRAMLIEQAKHQADADRAARKARAFEHRVKKLQRQLEDAEDSL
nr:hypothetical protein [uncultured Trichococcus sp.]